MSTPPSKARILDAARRLVAERGPHAVTLSEIAEAAGVSRQLVYLQFENRAGLLVALARHLDEQSGTAERMREAARLGGPQALEDMIRAWCDYIPDILDLGRALEAASITGDDGAAAWADRMRDLRSAFRIAVRKLEAEGRLAPGWSVETATDWVYASTHLSTYAHLVVERGWSPDEFAERAARAVLREVVADRETRPQW